MQMQLHDQTNTIDIKLEQVPSHLQEGDFFRTFDASSDELISVPPNVVKADLSVRNAEEFHELLMSLRYWVVDIDNYHDTIIMALKTIPSDDLFGKVLIREFYPEFPTIRILQCLLRIPRDNRESKYHPLPLVQHYFNGHDCSKSIIAYLVKSSQHIVGKDDNEEKLKEYLSTCCVHSVVRAGHLTMLQCLYEHGIVSTSLCYNAAEAGQLACLEYLVRKGSHLYDKTSRIAATNGHLHILKFLHENEKLFDLWCCRVAAANGHLACLQFLHSIIRPWGVFVPAFAARNGHLDCLTFAHENGCPWDASTCCDAAEGGHLACLKYAHEKGCDWDQRTTLNAIKHFPCLQYALDNGCPYSPSLADIAYKSGLPIVGEYILANCPGVRTDVTLVPDEKESYFR